MSASKNIGFTEQEYMKVMAGDRDMCQTLLHVAVATIIENNGSSASKITKDELEKAVFNWLLKNKYARYNQFIKVLSGAHFIDVVNNKRNIAKNKQIAEKRKVGKLKTTEQGTIKE